MSGPTMARDLRRPVALHCDPVLNPACRRRARFDPVSVIAWAMVLAGGGFVLGLALGGVL